MNLSLRSLCHLKPFYVFIIGVLSTLGNGYVIFISARQKKKLKPAEIMTVNLAVCDFGISGNSVLFYCSLYLQFFWS